MTGLETGLEIANLTVEYGTARAVDDISLLVGRGEVFGLVGPSGCGKSTVLRAIAGLVEPSSGSISWAGSSLREIPTHRRGVGLMFQDHALFTHRSVADNVAFGLRMKGTSAADQRERVGALLEQVGLVGFGERDVGSLSGGEAQRVALARALAPEPDLLLLDEPLAALDRALRADLNEQLAGLLRGFGQTAIYVTHDQHEAFAICDRIGVMQQGSIRRTGTPAEIWTDPQSAFVARFVGHEAIVEHGDITVAIRSDAVQIGANGDRVGVVRRCLFEGDRWRVVIDLDGAPLSAWVPAPVAVGAEVRFSLDPDRLARIIRD